MSAAPTTVSAQERELLSAARQGDENAFRRLIETYERELHAHCYRMLGSLHDAEDALQDAFLRAWRALPRFEVRTSFRAWLYRIATNTCLDVIAKRPKRVLPLDYGPPVDPHSTPGRPLSESVWIEPYPDERFGLADGLAGPEARYEQRESLELAFVAALQLLPGNQRAALILREVLGFSAKEVAESLDTTVASVNSALQRARQTLDEKLPEQSQQAALRSLGDDGVREIVERYMDVMDRGDVAGMVALLAEDAAWSMPPMSTWFRGLESIEAFLTEWPLSGEWRWKRIPAHANGQAAVGSYSWDEESGTYRPFALDVLTLEGSRIKEVTSFITRAEPPAERLHLARWPEEPQHERRFEAAFERFGLPDELPA